MSGRRAGTAAAEPLSPQTVSPLSAAITAAGERNG